MTPTDRIDALRDVCQRFAVETEDPRFTSTEDLAPYLAGEEPIGRYVAITAHTCDDGTAFFAYPCSSRDEARARACANIGDDIYDELPDAVVDLDTGEAEPVALVPLWPAQIEALTAALAAVGELHDLKRELSSDYTQADVAAMAAKTAAAESLMAAVVSDARVPAHG